MTAEHLLILSLLGFLLVALAGWWWSARRGSIASRARNARAQAGESDAERLLARRGYQVVDRQVTGEWWMWVDGEPVRLQVRADLLVRRGHDDFVAEVKTGSRAPDPAFPATRRQLLEYGRVFPGHGLLLVDVEAGAVREVRFD